MTNFKIISIKPINFWERVIIKEYIPALLLASTTLIFFTSWFINFTIIFALATIYTIIALYKYITFVYAIEIKDNTLIIYYLNWNKEKVITINMLDVIIDFNTSGFYRRKFEIIAFRFKYDYFFYIEPELSFPSFWTDEKISDTYSKLIEIQKNLKEVDKNKE
jgi:hypothetical protein